MMMMMMMMRNTHSPGPSGFHMFLIPVFENLRIHEWLANWQWFKGVSGAIKQMASH